MVWTKEQLKKYQGQYYQKNKTRLKLLQQKWRKTPRGIVSTKKSRIKNKLNKKEQDHRYYLKNKARLLAMSKDYIKAHPEMKKAISKRYYWKHREQELARKKLPAYKEKFKTYSKKWREANKEQIKIAGKQYRQRPEVKAKLQVYRREYSKKPERKEWQKRYKSRPEVHERYMALSREYRKTEKGKAIARFYNQRRRERKLGLKENFTREEFLNLLNQTEGLCPLCKNPFTQGHLSRHELSIDHNPPVSKAPKGFVYTIDNIKLICRSCNAKKGNRGSNF